MIRIWNEKYRLMAFLTMIIFLMIPFSVYAFTESIIYCEDLDTLVENITVYMDNNATTLTMAINCTYGCDNVTNICNPPVYQQDLTNIIVTIIIIFVLIIFSKWVLR